MDLLELALLMNNLHGTQQRLKLVDIRENKSKLAYKKREKKSLLMIK